MPINESPARHSDLTDEQQREALAAAYSLSGAPMSPNANTDFTYEERVKMRRHLDEMDAKEAAGRKEFDLNKPPVPPYVYREYPFLMYNHATRRTRAAHSHAEKQKMLGEGWSEDPIPAEVPEVALTAAERMQAEEIDRQLKMPREQLEIERSAEHMARMRAENEELRARLAQAEAGDRNDAETAEMSEKKANAKRSKV